MSWFPKPSSPRVAFADFRAFLRHQLRDRGTDAAARARYDDDFAFHHLALSHICLPKNAKP